MICILPCVIELIPSIYSYIFSKYFLDEPYYTQGMKIELSFTSGQDGGVGRHTMPPHTIKRRTTINLKTKDNQNWQKIKLYGRPTTKELKKKHSSIHRRGGDGQPGIEDSWQGGGWWTQWSCRLQTGWSHIHVQVTWEEQLGRKTDHSTQGSSAGK